MDAFPPDAFERGVVAGVMRDERFLRFFGGQLRVAYVDSDPAQWILRTALQYWGEAGKTPPLLHYTETARREMTAGQMTAGQLEAMRSYVRNLQYDHADLEYVFLHLREFCKRQALIEAFSRAAGDLQAGQVDAAVDRILAAARTGQDVTRPQYELFRDASRWLAELRETSIVKATTGLPALDREIGGGLRAGELGIWMAPTNRGKSHLLVWCGVVAAIAGRRVLHVTLEMSQAMVCARYAGSLTGVLTRNVFDQAATVAEELERMRAAVEGEVYPEWFPSRSLSLAELRALVQSYEDAGRAVDLLVLDYGDLLKPPSGSREGRWVEQGQVFEELRGLVGELGIPCWTATQTNRGGYRAESLDLDAISEAFGKALVADVVVAVEETPADRLLTQGTPRRFFTLAPRKVRSGEVGRGVKVVAHWDRTRVELFQDGSAAVTGSAGAAVQDPNDGWENFAGSAL